MTLGVWQPGILIRGGSHAARSAGHRAPGTPRPSLRCRTEGGSRTAPTCVGCNALRRMIGAVATPPRRCRRAINTQAMTYDPRLHRRRSIRLKGYDYSQAGAYFVTVVVRDRSCLFGSGVDGAIQLNDTGRLVRDSWEWLAVRYPYVTLDEYVVMPNHLHGIVVIADPGSNGVGRQGLHGRSGGATQVVWCLQSALQRTSSLRIQAVRATSFGLPAATKRW